MTEASSADVAPAATPRHAVRGLRAIAALARTLTRSLAARAPDLREIAAQAARAAADRLAQLEGRRLSDLPHLLGAYTPPQPSPRANHWPPPRLQITAALTGTVLTAAPPHAAGHRPRVRTAL